MSKKDINQMPKKNPLSLQLNLNSFERATDEEKHLQERMRESTTFFKDGMRRLSRNKVAMTCLTIMVSLLPSFLCFIPIVTMPSWVLSPVSR